MNTKNILSVFVSLAFMFLLVASVSALTISSPSQELTQASNQTTLTLTNDNGNTQNVTVSVANIIDGANSVPLTLTPTSISNLANGATQTLTVTGTSFSTGFKFGKYTSILTATGTNSTGSTFSSNATITYSKTFCTAGVAGTNLTIKDVDVSSSGDEDNEWRALDTITIDVEAENTGSTDLDDVVVELGLYDNAGNEVSNDLDFEDADEEKKDIGSLDEGDEETVTFTFTVPADFDEGNYKLVVKVYSEDEGERNVCDDTSSTLSNTIYHSVSVEREDDEGKFIAFDNIKFSPTEATCSDPVTMSFDAVNIGDEDQEQVKINIKSTILGINEVVEIREDLDSGDEKTISFTFTVPSGLSDKLYPIELSAEYDYKDSTDSYRESSDSPKQVLYKVFGCTPSPAGSGSSSSKVVINADLTSDAKAGTPLTVKATIKNNQATAGIFSVSVNGYDSWATLNTVSDRIVQLNAGQSKDVTLSFAVNPKASGEKSFTIETRSDSGDVQQKEVVVNVEAKSGLSLGKAFEGNGLIWAIGIINVILIVLIIVVAVKLSNR